MPAPARPALLALFAALGAGCVQTSPSEAQTPDSTAVVVDSVAAAGLYDAEDDLVASGALALSGGAVWDTLTVAEWMALAATTPEERARADEAATSGAFLGDPMRAVRLQSGAGPGTASATSEEAIGTAFETEVLHRFDPSAGSGQAAGGGRLDLTFSGEAADGGRRMPSVLRVSFFLEAEEPRVVVHLGAAEGELSELARAALPDEAAEGALAHRIGVQYEPGQVVVLFDGAPVVEAEARLGGGPMTATVGAIAPAGGRAYLLRWVLDTGS